MAATRRASGVPMDPAGVGPRHERRPVIHIIRTAVRRPHPCPPLLLGLAKQIDWALRTHVEAARRVGLVNAALVPHTTKALPDVVEHEERVAGGRPTLAVNNRILSL